jgi:hypothetical protein
MAKKPSALAGIFDEETEDSVPASVPELVPEPQWAAAARRSADTLAPTTPVRRSSHPGKKPVLIHIPEDMHRALRQLSVEGGRGAAYRHHRTATSPVSCQTGPH